MPKPNDLEEFAKKNNVKVESRVVGGTGFHKDWEFTVTRCPPKGKCESETFRMTFGEGWRPSGAGHVLAHLHSDARDVEDVDLEDYAQSWESKPDNLDVKKMYDEDVQVAKKMKKLLGQQKYKDFLEAEE